MLMYNSKLFIIHIVFYSESVNMEFINKTKTIINRFDLLPWFPYKMVTQEPCACVDHYLKKNF